MFKKKKYLRVVLLFLMTVMPVSFGDTVPSHHGCICRLRCVAAHARYAALMAYSLPFSCALVLSCISRPAVAA
jgi:hypothetical protein